MEGKIRAGQRRGRDTKVKTKAVPRRRPRSLARGDNAQVKREVSTVFSLFACMAVLVISTIVIISVFDDRNVFEIIMGESSQAAVDIKDETLFLADEKTPKKATPKDVLDNYLAKDIDAKAHDYDWGNLYTDGAFRFYSDNEKKSKMGIDVSYHQEKINWKKVKAAGIEFAIIRIGYRGYVSGKVVLDERYKENIKAATEVGIDVGLYFFTQAVTTKEAVEEAEFVLKNIGDYKIKYPIVIDTEAIDDGEGRSHGADLSQKELTNICKAFCDRIDKAGYHSSIYASKSWFINNLDLEQLDGYDKWLAHYTAVTDYPFEFDMWQYTDAGKIDGINGRVDLNISFRDYD